jgi:hypothetical protein
LAHKVSAHEIVSLLTLREQYGITLRLRKLIG